MGGKKSRTTAVHVIYYCSGVIGRFEVLYTHYTINNFKMDATFEFSFSKHCDLHLLHKTLEVMDSCQLYLNFRPLCGSITEEMIYLAIEFYNYPTGLICFV